MNAPPATTGYEAGGRPASADERRLYERAMVVAESAYAPYSGFRVGAALRSGGGEEFDGVNVENGSFPVGLCAERVALGALVTAGRRDLAAVAVASPAGDAVPCGACLQALSEFGDPLLTCRVEGQLKTWRLSELLRLPFSFVGESS